MYRRNINQNKMAIVMSYTAIVCAYNVYSLCICHVHAGFHIATMHEHVYVCRLQFGVHDCPYNIYI